MHYVRAFKCTVNTWIESCNLKPYNIDFYGKLYVVWKAEGRLIYSSNTFNKSVREKT